MPSAKMSVGVVLHYTCHLPYPPERISNILDAIINQNEEVSELIILNNDAETDMDFDITSVKTTVIPAAYITVSVQLNKAIETAESDFILYIDNLAAEIYLKRSYIEAAQLIVEKYPRLGMLYADYELITDGIKREIRLLKYHVGRVRDNQDYGKLFFFSRNALQEVGYFDESVKYNTLYDIRLKLSEKFKVIHIANKFSGSLYQVVAEGKKHNVFDYLLAGKESQKEAENILTNHLKRIGAYLEPGAYYHKRPETIEEYKFLASVVIPVNNRPDFIETAIESVFQQTEQNIEIIVVVNGGFDDPTTTAVESYMPGGTKYDQTKPPVTLIVTDINNIGLSLDLGIKKAKGKCYVQLDSDDRLKPDAVEKIIDVFDSDEKIGMVIGSYEMWEKKDTGEFFRIEEIPVVTHDEWTENNGRNNLLRVNGAGAPRSIPIQIIKDMGYFGINDEPYAQNYGEDYNLVLRISEEYRIGRIWDPIYEVVRHSGGTDHSIDQHTIDRNDEAKDYMRMKTIEWRIKINKGSH